LLTSQQARTRPSNPHLPRAQRSGLANRCTEVFAIDGLSEHAIHAELLGQGIDRRIGEAAAYQSFFGLGLHRLTGLGHRLLQSGRPALSQRAQSWVSGAALLVPVHRELLDVTGIDRPSDGSMAAAPPQDQPLRGCSCGCH
jgi:hypothetical protein